jgi:hypothetical protein
LPEASAGPNTCTFNATSAKALVPRDGRRFPFEEGHENRLDHERVGGWRVHHGREQAAVLELTLQHFADHLGDGALPDLIGAVGDRKTTILTRQVLGRADVRDRRHEHRAVAGALVWNGTST